VSTQIAGALDHRFAFSAKVLGKAQCAVRCKVKPAAAGAKKTAGKVERAMSPQEPAAKRKAGPAKKAARSKTTTAKSAVKKGVAKVKKTARKVGAAVTKDSTASNGTDTPRRRCINAGALPLAQYPNDLRLLRAIRGRTGARWPGR
jgi:hypothetical protein